MAGQPLTGDQVEARKPEWIWPVRVPGTVTQGLEGRIAKGVVHILAGPRDKGKGLITVRIGADLIRAGFTVLHSAIEDDPGLMTKPRYVAAGCTPGELKRLHLWRFRLPEREAEFKEYCLKHKVDVVVIDPLASHLSGNVSRGSDSIRQVTDPLVAFCEQTGIAVIVVDHTIKRVSRGQDPLSAIAGGGSGMPAVARLGYLVGVDPDTDADRILCHVKHNICSPRAAMRFELDVAEVDVKTWDPVVEEVIVDQEEFPSLTYTEECIFDPMRLLVDDPKNRKLGRPDDRKAAACEWLTNYLYTAFTAGLPAIKGIHKAVAAGGGVPAGRLFEDAKQSGLSEKTCRRAKDEMGVEVHPPGGGRNATWNLSKEILDLLTGGDDEPVPVPDDDAPEPPEADGEPDGDTPKAKTVDLKKEPVLDPDSDNFNAELAKMLASYDPSTDHKSEDEDGGDEDEAADD
jgi:hypothetical protein